VCKKYDEAIMIRGEMLAAPIVLGTQLHQAIAMLFYGWLLLAAFLRFLDWEHDIRDPSYHLSK
jgi:hypothetical protein